MVKRSHKKLLIYMYMNTIYILIQAHALIDAHAPAAQNTSHQIHTKCLLKHSKIVPKHYNSGCIPVCLDASHAQIVTSL